MDILNKEKQTQTNGHQLDYLPSSFLTAESFLKAHSWVSKTSLSTETELPSSIWMASLIMKDLKIGWIDKSSVILAPKEDFQYIKATLGLHCTHAHNLDLEQMRLSQYSAEYFQKVKFLQYLKDQADIKQNENVGTRKPHFICISAAFCKKNGSGEKK